MSMRGATLIELLVGMLLAGIVVAGALTALLQLQRTWQDSERIGRMHERAQYAFGTLEPDLQMAGYYGSAPQPQVSMVNAAALSSCGENAVLPLQPALSVLDGNWSLSCPAQGQGAQPGSDVLIVRRASTRIAGAPDGSVRLQGDAADPGQRELLVRIYYVARASDGDARTPALRVKSLTAVAGTPAFVDTEVMPGVDAMQIELLPNSTAPHSVRLRMKIRADAADLQTGKSLPALELDRRFNLRNARS
jgi:Tfp pilus assembly protein PilW